MPLLSCIVWGQVSGVSLNIHTHMGLHTRSAMFSLQRSMDHSNLAQHFLLSTSCSLGNRHLVWIISGAQSDVHIVQEVWYASLVQVQSLRLGKEVVAVLVWLMGQHQGLRGSEAQRLISLTTGRTPEPLNPGLHSVRSTALWDSSRGALTAQCFGWTLATARAVHDDPTPPLSQSGP